MEGYAASHQEASPAIAAISREIVKVHARFFGRGPTKSKTVWRNDIVVCILGEIYNKGEQVLIDSGRFEQVRTNRMAFQDAVEPLLRQVVEEATGASVLAFFSQVSPEGWASEVFLLESGSSSEAVNSD